MPIDVISLDQFLTRGKEIADVDYSFAKLVNWGKANLTQRERDLINVFTHHNRAFLTSRDLEIGRGVKVCNLEYLRSVIDSFNNLGLTAFSEKMVVPEEVK